MIVSRFAPSPTGRLHLGHAYSAVLGHARARASGGKWLLRIEDLDQTRSRTEFVDGIIEDLRWLELTWRDPMLVQSERSGTYAEALGRISAQGLVYPCFCTRADIASAVAAPHSQAPHYPGTCRGLPDDPDRRALGPHSWRLNSREALRRTGLPSWSEQDGRSFACSVEDFDDVILARKDAPAAYHLACVVDDAESGVNLVVRGADLRPSTPIQRLLQMLLDLPKPDYLHHGIIVHEDGRRLAKRDLAPTLGALREGGIDGAGLARQLEADLVPSGFRLAST